MQARSAFACGELSGGPTAHPITDKLLIKTTIANIFFKTFFISFNFP